MWKYRRIIDDNYAKAEKILKSNLAKLHAMSDALMQFETIDEKQIDDVMNNRKVSKPSGWDDVDKDEPEDDEETATKAKQKKRTPTAKKPDSSSKK